MSAQKVKLEIGGASYVVSTNDPDEYILALAERLDEDLNRMMIETPNASVTAAAVITALGYLDEIEKTSRGADNMRDQIQDYLEDAAKARLAAEEARREADRLRNELSHYTGKPAQPRRQPAQPSVENIEGQMDIDELDDME